MKRVFQYIIYGNRRTYARTSRRLGYVILDAGTLEHVLSWCEAKIGRKLY